MIPIPFALLAAQNTSAVSNAGTFMVLGAVVAAVRRRQPIGGWLFFFCWQIFIGCGLAVIQIASNPRSYTPAAWTDSNLYLLYILSFTPQIVVLFTVGGVCIALVRTMEWRWVIILRATLTAYFIAAVVTLTINLTYFPTDRTASTAALMFPLIFLVYTYRSERFRRVFRTHDWIADLGLPVVNK